MTTPLTTGLICSLEADAITGKVNNDPITTWEDAHTSNNDATGGSPLYKTNILNGLPGVLGNGTTDLLSIAGVTNNDATRTVTIVAQAVSVGNRRPWCNGTDLASIRPVSTTNWDYSVNHASGVENLGGAPQSADIITIVYNSTASCDAYVNGSLVKNFDPHDSYQGGSAAFTIFAAPGGTTPYDGYVFELIIKDVALSAGDVATDHAYLFDKWLPGPTLRVVQSSIRLA